MATHHITDEELDSLLSDYMTKESIELIVNKVRSGEKDTVVHEDVEVKLKLLRRLWRWLKSASKNQIARDTICGNTGKSDSKGSNKKL
jgi:hypothetical protein